MRTSPYLFETIDLIDMSSKIHHKLEAISIMANSSFNRRLKVGAEELSKKWAIGQQIANNTIKVTTQSFIHSAVHPSNGDLERKMQR
jgi:hypothetical protein